jgi:hypothetical protein
VDHNANMMKSQLITICRTPICKENIFRSEVIISEIDVYTTWRLNFKGHNELILIVAHFGLVMVRV